jgi:hypothetical protein
MSGLRPDLSSQLPGYEFQPLPDGMRFELIRARDRGYGCTLAFITLWTVLWNLVAIPFGVIWMLGQHHQGQQPGAWFGIPFILVGIGGILGTLNMAYVRRSWILSPGCVTRRAAIPKLGHTRDRIYADVHRVEIRHGVWHSGRGSTDILRFRTNDGSRPVNIETATSSPSLARRKELRAASPTGSVGWRDLIAEGARRPVPGSPVPIAPDLVALGEVVSRALRVPLQVVVERIPDPPPGVGG